MNLAPAACTGRENLVYQADFAAASTWPPLPARRSCNHRTQPRPRTRQRHAHAAPRAAVGPSGARPNRAAIPRAAWMGGSPGGGGPPSRWRWRRTDGPGVWCRRRWWRHDGRRRSASRHVRGTQRWTPLHPDALHQRVERLEPRQFPRHPTAISPRRSSASTPASAAALAPEAAPAPTTARSPSSCASRFNPRPKTTRRRA